MRSLYILFSFMMLSGSLFAQGTSYTFKGGFSGSFVEWLGFNDDPLLAPHAAVEIEGFTEDDKSSLFASLGYYTHGSSSNISSIFTSSGQIVNVSGKFKVNNLGLILGAKGKKELSAKSKAYYSLGIRGEYNISNNFKSYLERGLNNSTAFPEPVFLNKITYGVTAGGGIQFELSDRYDGILEVNINPDISKQYAQPALQNVPSPNGSGTINIRERSIRNLLVVLTFGIRLIKY